MGRSARLVFNVIVSYGRMALTVIPTILITRLLLSNLGVVDFGLVAALTAAASLMAIIADAMAHSSQRYLAFEIGRGDETRLAGTFSTSFAIYSILAVLTCLVGALLSPLLLDLIDAPAERTEAVVWCYGFMVIAVALNIVRRPFDSLLIARQRLDLLALLDLLDRAALLGFVYAMGFADWDQLILYSGGSTILVALAGLIRAFLCMLHFPESRAKLALVEGSLFRDLAGFAGWSLMSAIVSRAVNQGSMLAVTSVHGAVANAAYAISDRALRTQQSLLGAIFMSIGPAITTAEGQNDRTFVVRLVQAMGKYATLVQLLLALPVLLDTENILKLWLSDYPPMSTLLVQLALLEVFAHLSAGVRHAVRARGDAAALAKGLDLPNLVCFLLTVGVMVALSLPAWVLPAQRLVWHAFSEFFLVHALFGKLIGLEYRQWLRATVLPIALATTLTCAVDYAVILLLPTGALRVVATFLTNTLCLAICSWAFILTSSERIKLKALLKSRFARSADTAQESERDPFSNNQ